MLATGAFDWRASAFAWRARNVVESASPMLEGGTRAALADLLDELPERLAALAGCGLPDTLVHGDFHPGNVRGDDEHLTVMDWGDSGVGHPLLDQAAFLEWVPAEHRQRVRSAWAAAWRAAVPGSDPERAGALVAPLAAVRQAVIYQLFLDNIEPVERVYHVGDPPMWLDRAAALYREGPRLLP
jgi:aminoglycoside phosphotransferase (APT) family kinase protein